MREIESYERYCDYCKGLGIAPATLETWRRVTGRIGETNYQFPAYKLPNPGYEIVQRLL